MSLTNDGNLGQICIRADEMISDTFIIPSFFQSIHYHYRQPVWPIMSALKSIEPQWISRGRENEQTVCLHLWQGAQCLFRQMALFNSVMKNHTIHCGSATQLSHSYIKGFWLTRLNEREILSCLSQAALSVQEVGFLINCPMNINT